jgi:hypothetical protein
LGAGSSIFAFSLVPLRLLNLGGFGQPAFRSAVAARRFFVAASVVLLSAAGRFLGVPSDVRASLDLRFFGAFSAARVSLDLRFLGVPSAERVLLAVLFLTEPSAERVSLDLRFLTVPSAERVSLDLRLLAVPSAAGALPALLIFVVSAFVRLVSGKSSGLAGRFFCLVSLSITILLRFNEDSFLIYNNTTSIIHSSFFVCFISNF